jgi:hypothetical protein
MVTQNGAHDFRYCPTSEPADLLRTQDFASNQCIGDIDRSCVPVEVFAEDAPDDFGELFRAKLQVFTSASFS